MKKKLYAMIMSLCLLVAAFPLSVFADDTEITSDGQAVTNLTFTTEQGHGSSNNFIVHIPTSISWDEGDTTFYISLDESSTLDEGFKVTVDVDPISFYDNVSTLRLAASDPSYYYDFSVINSNRQTVNNENQTVAQFSNEGALPNGRVQIHMLSDNSNGAYQEYNGSLTFNISSGY